MFWKLLSLLAFAVAVLSTAVAVVASVEGNLSTKMPEAIFYCYYSADELKISCSQDLLFAASEDTNGVTLSIFYTGADYSNSHSQLTIQQKRLSPECGKDSFRCENPLMLTTTLTKTAKQHIILVPLEDGLLITELVQNYLVVKFGNHFLLDTSQNQLQHCSPVKVFEISDAYYLVCVDSVRSYVSMHLLYLNKTSLSDTTISNSPITAFHLTELNIETLSNFVHLTEGGIRLVTFSIEDTLYAFDTLAYTGFIYYGNIGTNCTRVNRLEFLGNSRLMAYCPFVNVLYSVEVEDWEYEWSNLQKGILYPCPDSRVQVRVFSDSMYLQFSINDLAGNINLLGKGYKNGICFGAPNKPNLFAYSDLDGSAYVVNIAEQEVTRVTSAQCSNPGCLSIHVTDNRYLTVRENNVDKNIKIFDAEKNLSVVLNIPHYIPQVFILVNNITYDACDKTNGTVIIDLDTNTGAIVGGFAGTIVFAVLVLVVIVVIVWRKKRYVNQVKYLMFHCFKSFLTGHCLHLFKKKIKMKVSDPLTCISTVH